MKIKTDKTPYIANVNINPVLILLINSFLSNITLPIKKNNGRIKASCNISYSK